MIMCFAYDSGGCGGRVMLLEGLEWTSSSHARTSGASRRSSPVALTRNDKRHFHVFSKPNG